MAVVMMFPYVTSLPVVMASEGKDETETYEISKQDLENEYAREKDDLIKEKKIKKELEKYLYLQDDGTLVLLIPKTANPDVTKEDINAIIENINIINEMVDNDEAYVLENFEVFINDYDDGFFTMFRIYSFKITWTGVFMKLDGQAAMAFGIGTIVFHLESLLGDVSNLMKLTNRDAIASIFATAMFIIPAHLLSHTVVTLIESNMGLIVGALLSLNLALMTTGGFATVAKTAVKYLLGQYIPSMVKAGEMIQYGMLGYHYSADIELLKFKAYYNRV